MSPHFTLRLSSLPRKLSKDACDEPQWRLVTAHSELLVSSLSA